MADLRISDLVTASQLKNDDYYEIAQSESGTRVSYKTTLLAIAVQIATMVDFTSDLNTTSKKITGAINELKQLISLIPQFSIEVVEELPTEDISDTTIYLVPAEDPEVGNYYEEYIHVNNTWELVGTTAVDLSAYYTKLEVDAKFSELATVATSGSYNDLTNKPDLSALMDVNETTFTNPYTKKLVPSGAYTEKLRKIVGATVNWNQLIPTINKSFTNTTTDTRASLVLRLRETASPYTQLYQLSTSAATHDVAIFSAPSSFTGVSLVNVGVQSNIVCWSNQSMSILSGHKYLIGIDVTAADPSTVGGFTYDNLRLTDLTAMFNSPIADRAYTLEQAETGSGIAWLKSYGFFRDLYNAYTAGGLQSVSLAAKKNVGANLWGGNFLADSICSVIPNATKDTTTKTVSFGAAQASRKVIFNTIFKEKTSYTVILKGSNSTANQNTNLAVRYTDESFATIQFPTSTAGAIQTAVLVTNANKSVKEIIGANYGGQTTLYYEECGMFEGILTANDFIPYTETTYPLDHTELRGLFKLDSNNNLYADGDEYPSDGNGYVKYEEVDLGDLNWDGDVNYYIATISGITTDTDSMCTGYERVTGTWALNNRQYRIGTNAIRIVDTNYTTVEAFKTAVIGQKLLYKKATASALSLTSYEKLQVIEQGGTEEFIDYGVQSGTRDVAIPAGNETAYGDNELMGKVINYMNT